MTSCGTCRLPLDACSPELAALQAHAGTGDHGGVLTAAVVALYPH